MHPRSRTSAATAPRRVVPVAALLALVAALLAGCSGGDAWATPRTGPSAVGTLGPGFVEPGGEPSPEGTLTPAPESWSGVRPAPGYRVVLLTAGDDEPTTALATAVTQWADAEKVDLRTVVATEPDEVVTDIQDAVELRPDLIVSAGNDLVDPMALVTAGHLDQQFLVVGAEIAEPTANVTAVDWVGASFRGEGLGLPSAYDPTSFTPERCAAAIRAGVASVLAGYTGIVVRID